MIERGRERRNVQRGGREMGREGRDAREEGGRSASFFVCILASREVASPLARALATASLIHRLGSKCSAPKPAKSLIAKKNSGGITSARGMQAKAPSVTDRLQ